MTTPGLKADVMQLPPTGVGAQPGNAWSGIPGSSDNVLFANNDVNNTWYLGFRNTITVGGPNTIPVPPSGTVTLGANRTVYANAALGTTPLVVIPGGVAYFQGLTQGQGQLVLPSIRSPNFIHNVSGWTINKDGSVEFNNGLFRGTITGSVFRATNAFGATVMTINKTTGTWILYVDLGSATQGPMAASGNNSNTNFTDEFGNTALVGLTSYGGVSGAWTAVQIDAFSGVQGVTWWYSSQVTQVTWFTQGSILQTLNGAMILSNAGLGIQIAAGEQLNFAGAGGQGPFILGETFHAVTLPSTGGFTGRIRVKKLPWNAIWLDVSVQWTGTTGTTYTCGALPDSTYYPTQSCSFPISVGDTPNTDIPSRIIVPTSGALSIFTGASTGGSGSVANCGCDVMYPTN